jgi:RimJ/RimL family protein N-acetyltransferase
MQAKWAPWDEKEEESGPHAMRQEPTLETDHLLLRPHRESDWQAMHAIDADPEVQRFLGERTITEQQTRDFVRRTRVWAQERPRTRYDFAIVLKAAERLIGGCFLLDIEPHLRQAEMGYQLARDVWGQGYATEAARALLDFALSEAGLHRVWARCDTDNVASWRVMEKLGMRREGHLRECDWREGAWRDCFLYAVLEREWREGL